MFGLKKKYLPPVEIERFVVRCGDGSGMQVTASRYRIDYKGDLHRYAITDTISNTVVDTAECMEAASKMVAQLISRAAMGSPYIFDSLLAQKVYEDSSLQNCIDHAAMLNRSDREHLRQAPEQRWQEVAYALVKGHLQQTPSGWDIIEESGGFDVVSFDGTVIARCNTRADATHVLGLSDYILGLADTYRPRDQAIVHKPHRAIG